MALALSTDAVAPQDRFELWTAWGSGIFAPLRHRAADRTTPASGRDFWGRIWARDLGTVGATCVSAAAHEVRRGRPEIAAGDPEVLWLSVQLEGRSTLVRGDRVAALAPGDMALYDSSHAYAIHSPGPMTMAVFQLPRYLVRAPDQVLRDSAGVRIAAASQRGALASRALASVADALTTDALPGGDEELGELVVSLTRVMLTTGAPPPPVAAPAKPLLSAVKAYIERELGNPDLSPRSIAEHHYISLRYLYVLFADERESVWERIRARRLERCRQDLRDPAFRDWSVAAISARWGFKDPSHFNRAFRGAYGRSPTAYRRG